jgi:hypothetical protein
MDRRIVFLAHVANDMVDKYIGQWFKPTWLKLDMVHMDWSSHRERQPTCTRAARGRQPMNPSCKFERSHTTSVLMADVSCCHTRVHGVPCSASSQRCTSRCAKTEISATPTTFVAGGRGGSTS